MDIGGTFTDIATLAPDGTVATRKLLSTPDDYSDGVLHGLLAHLQRRTLGPQDIDEVLHACTVATNTVLEAKGARTALITTRGFRDVLELRRTRIPRLYDLLYRLPEPLVPRRLRLEVSERVDAQGNVLTPLNAADVDRAVQVLRAADVSAIAVCLLHSYANDAHERAIGRAVEAQLPGCFVSLSVDVLPQMYEYERTSTAVINAYVGPPVEHYLRSLIRRLREAQVTGRLMVMQSSGGILDVASVVRKPAAIVECGPAAGVIGAAVVGDMLGEPNLISFDMGGTTAKVSVIKDGQVGISTDHEVGSVESGSVATPLVGGGGHALKLPAVDIAEIGAGGGSMAHLDKAGRLKVGPQSACAAPGPVCYGAGGRDPTVTDANVVLGFLNPTSIAGGAVPIDLAAAERAVASLAESAGRDPMQTARGIHE
ncbi:MAG: hydantoinase, partial [Phycisphaeraceae bacterium]|nr:hydantoinase [Phycisphaeraceae bacterium]